MDFDVSKELIPSARRLAYFGGVEPEVAHRLRHGHTMSVAALELRRIERAGDGAAAGERGAKARAFLVGEAHHFNGEAFALVFSVKRRHAFDANDDAKHAVVFPGIAHGVEMRADHQRREARRATL